MISDDELKNLPMDNAAAFVQLVDVLNAKLVGEGSAWRARAQQYAQVLLAFMDEHKLEGEMEFALDRNMPADDSGEFFSWFNSFQNGINYLQARYRFRLRGGQVESVTVHLNARYRQEIHELLNRIRKVVANLQISERKRNAIYESIAKLEAEVDKSQTRIDALMEFILDSSAVAGEAADNFEPVVKLAERIRDLFAKARAEGKAPALPSPEGAGQAKRIEGPALPKRPAQSTSSTNSLDDDVPF